MKLELIQTIGLRQKCEVLLDALIDLTVRVTDYVVYKHITLAEFSLFAFAAGRALWFSFYGVQNSNFDYFFRDSLWTGYFVASSTLHLVGFFTKSCAVRLIGIYAYALAWGLLTFLAAWSQTSAPAVPAYLTWFCISFIVIVRLTRNKDVNGNC